MVSYEVRYKDDRCIFQFCRTNLSKGVSHSMRTMSKNTVLHTRHCKETGFRFSYKKKGRMWERKEVIISQCICLSQNHFVQFKYVFYNFLKSGSILQASPFASGSLSPLKWNFLSVHSYRYWCTNFFFFFFCSLIVLLTLFWGKGSFVPVFDLQQILLPSHSLHFLQN
jgi:hypothetical protein